MADLKISALPAATVPLAGTEVLPIVQGGVTTKVAVSDLTAGRAVSATQLTSTIAIGTAPLVVTSTTNVANLNASSLNGATFAAPGAIGGGTASAISATTINKVTITAPATASTLTIADGKTLAVNDNATLGTGGLTLGNSGGFTAAASKVLTANNTLTLAGTDATTMTFPGTSSTVVTTTTLANTTLPGSFTTIQASDLITASAPGYAVKLVAGVNSTYGSESMLVWYRANGTTRKGYVGFGSGNSQTLEFTNDNVTFSLLTAKATLTSPLEITGALNSTGVVTFSNYGAGAATFSAAGVISSVSDETWKTKDGVPSDPDAMLKKLQPGYWFYNAEKAPIYGTERQLGFYAQNVNDAIGPEAAPKPETGKPWGYYDRSVLAITVMSLQKALFTIESLTARIILLESSP